MTKLTVKLTKKAAAGTPAVHLVLEGEAVVGFIEKYRNTRSDTHPWKAFLTTTPTQAGLAFGAARYLGAFYDLAGLDGKKAALATITRELNRRRMSEPVPAAAKQVVA